MTNRLIQNFLLVLLTLQPGLALAQEIIPVTAVGMAALSNVTPEEAQKTALQRARVNAVEKACGVRVQAESLVRDFVLRGEFIHSVAYGNIVSEKVARWDYEVDQRDPSIPPAFSLMVTLKADVQKERGEPDPSFRVKVSLNKTVYQSGDDVIIKVRSTKPGYLTILNFTADDKVVVLFPNTLRKDNKIEPGKEYQYPALSDQQGILRLQVGNLPGHDKDTEYVKAIVTSRPFPLLEEIDLQGQYGVIDNSGMAVTEIARLIASVPIQERAGGTAAYEVVSR